MYSFVLTLHNLLRWLVLIVGVIAVIKGLIGWFGNRPWLDADSRLGQVFTISLDLQFFLGLLLYIFLSPITRTAFSDFGAAMSDSGLRFFAVEHAIGMLAAIVVAHIGRALSRRAEDDRKKHRQAAIFFGIAMLIILASIPWFRPLLSF